MTKTTEENADRLRKAALAMAGDPNFEVFITLLRERREAWVRDMAGPAVYHNHAELAATAAHVTELDFIIELATADAGQA